MLHDTLIEIDAALVGDALCSFSALYEYSKHKSFDLWFYSKYIQELFILNENIHVIEDRCEDYNTYKKVYTPRLNEIFASRSGSEHMIQSYFFMLDLPVPPQVIPPNVKTISCPEQFDFVLSPFSRSGPQVKEWTNEGWQQVIHHLNKYGKVCVLGSIRDIYDNGKPFEGVTYIYDYPLPQVADIIYKSKLCITIDNGISHLTHAVGTKHLLLYPIILHPVWVTNSRSNATVLRSHVKSIDPTIVIEIINNLL